MDLSATVKRFPFSLREEGVRMEGENGSVQDWFQSSFTKVFTKVAEPVGVAEKL